MGMGMGLGVGLGNGIIVVAMIDIAIDHASQLKISGS